MIRRSFAVFCLSGVVACAILGNAIAEPIAFRFVGTVQTGNLDATSLDGLSMVVEGVVEDETPDFGNAFNGTFFTEATTFSFGGGAATFVADPGTVLFSQGHNSPTPTFTQNGLHANGSFANVLFGNTSTATGPVYANPAVPEAVGLVSFVTSGRANGTPPWSVSNTAGETLNIFDVSLSTLETTPHTPVPEPSTVALCLLSGGLLAFVSRRR